MDPYDPLETCPYDPSHRVIRSGMQRHIVKCEINNRNKELVTCVFNSTHRIHRMHYDHHIENCEDAKEVISFTHAVENPNKINAISIDEIQKQFMPETENWDLDADVPAYDPTEHIENRQILRSLNCASKAKKAQFRAQERKRFQELDAKKEENANAKSKANGAKKSASLKETDYAFSNLTLSDLTNTAANPKNKQEAAKIQPSSSQSYEPNDNEKMEAPKRTGTKQTSWSTLVSRNSQTQYKPNVLGRGSRLQPNCYKGIENHESAKVGKKPDARYPESTLDSNDE